MHILFVALRGDFLDRVVTSVIAAEGNGQWTEYAGGFSDMQMQRRTTEMPSTKTKSIRRATESPGGIGLVPSSPSAKAAAAPKRKLTFKEKHALDTLPKTIEKLTADAARLQALLDDPALYNRDRAKFEQLSADAGRTRTALATAEDEWLDLEMARSGTDG